MRRNSKLGWMVVACVIVSFVLSDQLAAAAVPPGPPSPTTSQRVTATMMGMPLQFEANHGQVDAQVKFLSRGKGYTLFLTQTESVMVLRQREASAEKDALTANDPTAFTKQARIKQAVVRMKLNGANHAPTIDGMEQLPGIVNYFIGNDPEKWRTKIPTYAKVQYQDAYPGIALAYYGNQGKLEYDFIVAPGADPNQIKLAFEGASDIKVADSGDLLLTTALGDVRLQKPVVYQLNDDGHKKLVAGSYVVHSESHSETRPRITNPVIGIQVAAYDLAKPLVIDPTLVYSTYLGGGFDDGIVTGGLAGSDQMAVAVDNLGNAYVTGATHSTDFPTTAGAFDTTFDSNADIVSAFVTKLNPAGSALIYSTFLGSKGEGYGIAVDAAGDAYVTGNAGDTFPTTAGAFDTTFNGGGQDAFVTKLNSTGSALVYSTFLGGSTFIGFNHMEGGYGIAVDTTGHAYVTGITISDDFPTTLGAFDTTKNANAPETNHWDAFVTKLNPDGSALVYSTFLGGNNDQSGRGIAVDSLGNAYVTGPTFSSDFPTTPGAFDTTLDGGGDAFVTKLNPDGSALVYSTFLGGNSGMGFLDEIGHGIAIDSAGNAYVIGITRSSDFPTTPGAFATSPPPSGPLYAFVTKLNPTGSALVYSTFLGGSGTAGSGIALDASNNAYVTGYATTDFPTTPGAFDTTFNSLGKAFVTKLNGAGSGLIYSTLLGGIDSNLGFGTGRNIGVGIAVDAAGNAYVGGVTNSTNFPVTAGAFQPGYGGGTGWDAFVVKIVGDGADLSITKTARGPKRTSRPLTYKIVTVNSGPNPATEVILIDVLPPTATFVSASAGCAYTQGNHTVTCNLGSISSGSKTIMIVVIPTQGGTITNTATVTGSGTDPDMANNTSTAVTEIREGPRR